MRRHTIMGEQIVASVPALADLAPVIRGAHERFDGSGYPDGLAEHAIPLGSRILLTCDAYHAMRSSRPYRAAMTNEAAVNELVAGSRTQFDPTVVAALLDVLRRALRASAQPGDVDAWRLTAIAMESAPRGPSYAA
jgi:HD-GYP domain-containing protein (c-di-GMP phosphodiesterase class II)